MDTNQQKVAVYAHVSTQEQAVEGVSIETQVAALQAYARSQGWEIADEYIDGGYSGGTDERPALKRLLVDSLHPTYSTYSSSDIIEAKSGHRLSWKSLTLGLQN